MNKKMIAMAVAAGFAAPMVANAAPTLYGQLQAEIGSVDVGGTSATLSDDNKRGRLGVKGSEDLGNGLSGIYKFEFQVETTQADVDDGNRESYVGLKGDWGQVEAGSLKSAYKYAGGVKYDPFVATYLEARSNGGMSGKVTDLGGPASGAFGHHGFMTDSIAYQNKFGSMAFRITTSLDEAGGAKGRDGDMTASLKWSGKGWEVFGAMANDDEWVAPGGEYEATKVGGQWKSGAHKVSAQIENTEVSTPVGSVEADVWFLGYQFKMGKNVFVAQLGNTDFGAGAEIDYTAFGIIHKFSKKTRMFAGFRNSDLGVAEIDATSIGLRVDF